MQRFDAKRCAVKDGDGQARRNFAPISPVVEAREIIRPHEPHEATIAVVGLQKANAVDGVIEPLALLYIQHMNARVVGDAACEREAQRVIGQITRFFERVSGRDQPPDFIELKPL